MILLDTSVVIEFIEKRPGFLVCFEQLQRFELRHVHISAITVFDGSPNIRARRAR